SLKISLICEEKLNDPPRAFATLVEALPVDPAGRELLPNLERLAEVTEDWGGLLDVYARIARARTEVSDRVELLRLRAQVRERRINDASGALDETLRSFALSPQDPATQEEILRLSRVTGRWEEAIKVQGQLFALAEELPEKLSVARGAAHLVEHEVKDLVRAFRAYLNAFRLAPDDEEIVGHLWRLATGIGRYRDKDLPPPTADELAEADAHAVDGANGVSETESAIADGEDADESDGSSLDVVSEEVDLDVDLEAPLEETEETEEPNPFGAGETMAATAPAEHAGAGLATPGPVAVSDLDDDAIEEIGDEELLEEELVDEEMVARPPSPPRQAHDDEEHPYDTPWEELA